MTPLKANTFISFILLFVLLLLSGEAASQRRRRGVVPPGRQQVDSLRSDSLGQGIASSHRRGMRDTLQPDSLRMDTLAASGKKK